MRNLIGRMFMKSPFDELLPHARKVQECAWMFRKAIDCFLKQDCEEFDILLEEVVRLESEADGIKRNIRGHLPKGVWMVVDKFQLFMFLREQDKVLDKVQDSLQWLAMREETVVPDEIAQKLLKMVDFAVETIEMMVPMCDAARDYFRSPDNDRRQTVKDRIRDIRRKEHASDQLEFGLKRLVFSMDLEGAALIYYVRLFETVGDITDHAENAADMMRAMIAR
jgi:predicted phosphate transport protein (TIGR00153 family)